MHQGSHVSQRRRDMAHPIPQRAMKLLPVQVHSGVVFVEADLEGSVVAADETSGDCFGEVNGLVRGLRLEAKDVFPGWYLQSFRLDAMDPVEHDQPLLSSSVQGTREGQFVIDPDGKSRFLELVTHGKLDG